jgi:hypothetical protein
METIILNKYTIISLTTISFIYIKLNFYPKTLLCINSYKLTTTLTLLEILIKVNHAITLFAFYDFSKAFDGVWYNGLLFKLQTYGIYIDLLQWLQVIFVIDIMSKDLLYLRQNMFVLGSLIFWCTYIKLM